MAGEDSQDTGRDGLQRAKQWLDLSTRVRRSWAYDDPTLAEMVAFEWPHATGQARPFSFDLGGTFRGDSLHDQSFLAEVKNYRYESNLPVHFRDFLAKCYVALGDRPRRCDNFLWISWAPFQAQQWHRHASTEKVQSSLLHEANRLRVLGVDSEEDAIKKLDAERMANVASRVWLITLGERQEKLVPIEEHYYQMAEMFARERGVGL
jgi:hypothetical protein